MAFLIFSPAWVLGAPDPKDSVSSSKTGQPIESVLSQKEANELNQLVWSLGAYFLRGPDEAKSLSLKLGQTALTFEFTDGSGWPARLTLDSTQNEPGSTKVTLGPFPLGEKGAVRDISYLKLSQKLATFWAELAARPKSDQPRFITIRSGLDGARVKVNYGVRLGESVFLIYRYDPKVWALRPYYEAEEPYKAKPAVDIRGWVKRLPQAVLVLNGAQHYPDRKPMGLLKRLGLNLETKAHPSYQGFLAQDGPNPGIYDSADLDSSDLNSSGLGETTLGAYGTVLQSFMILDRAKKIRARQSYRLASRAFLGEDSKGFMWVVLVPGAITLADLAVLAQTLGLKAALGLDGGLWTQVALSGEEPVFGQYSHASWGNYRAQDLRPTLPVVLALEEIRGPLAP